MREVVEGMLYILETGCQWRHLPKDFPPRSTVWEYFDLWRHDGTLDRIHETLYPGSCTTASLTTRIGVVRPAEPRAFMLLGALAMAARFWPSGLRVKAYPFGSGGTGSGVCACGGASVPLMFRNAQPLEA